MSYPKVPPKPQRGPITKLSAQRKEKLLKLQEREELKGLLINKFKAKYAKSGGGQFIDKEVDKFMKSEVLTEENLARLDAKLKQQSEVESEKEKAKLRHAQEEVSGKPKSRASSHQQKAPSAPRSVAGSQKSVMTAGSHKEEDQISVASSRASVFSGLDNEEDEWAAILRYESIQFREEERARKQREKELKTRIRRELDKQMEEKKYKKGDECEEEKLYDEALQKNLQEFDNRENQKAQDVHDKIQLEKELRDKQLREEKHRKKNEDREQRDYDSQLVQRLQAELQAEQRALEQKRLEEKEYLKKVLQDNARLKEKQLEELAAQKQKDVDEAEAYIKLINKQEADRAEEYAARERRQQQLMARMADTVIKEQNQKVSAEDQMMLQQIKEREAFENEEDERRKGRIADQKREMKEFLEQQMLEKERKKELERQERMQQAEMWKKESEEFYRLEEEKANRQKDLNHKHADILKQQIDNKTRKAGKAMNSTEMALNKQKLRQVKYEQPGEKQLPEEQAGELCVTGQGV